MRTILKNCTVIDCTGRDPKADATIVIEDHRIEKITTDAHALAEEQKQGVRVFDLRDQYVMPGLWGVHTHLGAIFPDPDHLTSRESTAARTIRAGRNAMDALRRGVTGVRVVGDKDCLDVAWREAFNNRLFVGPRLFVAGEYILATGGHGHDMAGALEVDGPYEMRKAVREQLKHGVDWIKLGVTGGVATAGETMQESQLLIDEIKAATTVAHMKGKKVTVHAGGPMGVKLSIQGGVDCIEHGYYLDDEAIQMMADHDVYYVPTLFVTQYETFMRKSGMADYQIEKATTAAEAHREGFQKALEAGVKIACGADSSPVGEHTLVEVEQLAKAGMTPMQALMAATRISAELCDAGDQVGTVEPGKLADLIVLSANPLEDISNIRALEMVIKDGDLVDTELPEGMEDFWTLFWPEGQPS
jgi:imidazolonepropionase-like amidohydrolase